MDLNGNIYTITNVLTHPQKPFNVKGSFNIKISTSQTAAPSIITDGCIAHLNFYTDVYTNNLTYPESTKIYFTVLHLHLLKDNKAPIIFLVFSHLLYNQISTLMQFQAQKDKYLFSIDVPQSFSLD